MRSLSKSVMSMAVISIILIPILLTATNPPTIANSPTATTPLITANRASANQTQGAFYRSAELRSYGEYDNDTAWSRITIYSDPSGHTNVTYEWQIWLSTYPNTWGRRILSMDLHLQMIAPNGSRYAVLKDPGQENTPGADGVTIMPCPPYGPNDVVDQYGNVVYNSTERNEGLNNNWWNQFWWNGMGINGTWYVYGGNYSFAFNRDLNAELHGWKYDAFMKWGLCPDGLLLYTLSFASEEHATLAFMCLPTFKPQEEGWNIFGFYEDLVDAGEQVVPLSAIVPDASNCQFFPDIYFPCLTIDHPSDFAFTQGTTEPDGSPFSIGWIVALTDFGPANYSITEDTSYVESSGTIGNGTTVLTQHLNKALPPGTYIYTCTVWDSAASGPVIATEVVSDAIVVTVYAPLSIDSPPDVAYYYGTRDHSITWHPLSSCPTKYKVLDYDLSGDPPVLRQGSWDGGPITINVDGRSVGTHKFVCIVEDTNHRVSDEVIVTVARSLPPSIDSPPDMTYTFGTSGHWVTWHPSSSSPMQYKVFRLDLPDPPLFKEGSWDGSAIPVNIDGLSFGVYTFECTVWDTFGQTTSDQLIVTVPPPRPTIDSPPDVSYKVGVGYKPITWHPSSSCPSSYQVTRNGATVLSGSWAGGAITVNAGGLQVGSYTFTCTVWDTYGRSVSDSVTVLVNYSKTN